MELFESLDIINPVMERSIKSPAVRMYKGSEDVETSKDIVMVPVVAPTPDKPYVCEIQNHSD